MILKYLLIEFFVNEVEANSIESRHDHLNLNSGKVMMKCGMKYEGTMRKADIEAYDKGEDHMISFVDVLIRGIIKQFLEKFK